MEQKRNMFKQLKNIFYQGINCNTGDILFFNSVFMTITYDVYL